MKRAALAIVGTVASLVLLLSFKTHTLAGPAAATAAVASSTTPKDTTPKATASKATKPKNTAPKSSPTPTTATYTGAAAMTRYGPVQVQITVTDGKVTDATAVDYPTADPRDAQINGYAIPALNSEAVSAGSASIDMISGATFTSQGYLASLQSALDQAGL